VVDEETCARARRSPAEVATALLGAGVALLQVRGKGMGAAALLALARHAVQAGPQARIIVNDRPDVAVLAGAGGVHVGQEDLAPADARALVGHARWVGLSTHTRDQARRALDEPIDYLAIGPVFDTTTKRTGYAAVGLGMVEQVAALAAPYGVPVVAIGGITLARAPGVLAAGAASVCVISDLVSGDPAARAQAFLRALAGEVAGP
jgi:thiamine-phosphate pyrophosphorylase